MALKRKLLPVVVVLLAIPMVIGAYFGAKAMPFLFAIGAFAAFLPHPWPIFSDASPEEIARMPKLSVPARAMYFGFCLCMAVAIWFE